MLGEISNISKYLHKEDDAKLMKYLEPMFDKFGEKKDAFGFDPLMMSIKTATIFAEEIGVMREAILAILLYSLCKTEEGEDEELLSNIKTDFGEDVESIIRGLNRISNLYRRNTSVETDNFRNLLVNLAEDMRVVLLMIADRVNLMRSIADTKNTTAREAVAREASFLYAPLAHKLGLYNLKREIEDLSLRYLEPEPYNHIRQKLKDTEEERDKYIKDFCQPIEAKLLLAGLKFHIKARTKSINSIWQKMKKQNCEFEGVYDIFAIRIILHSPNDAELMQCWQVYSIVTDLYKPNPKRMRDWLSHPKESGYESLHITVQGPDNKWVEVQIRTERMDDVAERGLAAHWRYKGIKNEDAGADKWLANIRSALENNNGMQLMDQVQMELEEKEVYVFTPKGDLIKFEKGANVLDFAYRIHSNIGNKCIGAKINGKIVTIRQELKSGDEVEVMTGNNQAPKQDWLRIAKTSKARSKIRLALKEQESKQVVIAKELIERRFKNRKIELEEAIMFRLIKKLGYSQATLFYKDIADGLLDPNTVIEKYLEGKKPATSHKEGEGKSVALGENSSDEATLIIEHNLKGVDYQFAKCCQPQYGDDIFAFVTISGGIKIHRKDCPNAHDMITRFGYRILPAKWKDKEQE